MKYPLELIQWYDAESQATWADKEEMDKWCKTLPVATEIGWVYKETDEIIVMASQMFEDGTVGNRTKIPKKWLKSRKKVKPHEPKRRTKRNTDNPNSPK